MALRLFSKFRKLLDVTWGTPSNRQVPIYNSETDKLIMERIQQSDVNGLEASLDAKADQSGANQFTQTNTFTGTNAGDANVTERAAMVD